ncbi:LIM domain transcription factor LMO4-like isoform X1 [Gadus macrocephalus]|uniref:LIM domain transcription factor LMO4-like isoform X1 n=2 Tax=Gadus macrocephalus TaxID=80720 RepID=UPI0028CB6A19|nr:LIM domain transcription factor LMO4-like isoform X1 [Gadus macrocephalus]
MSRDEQQHGIYSRGAKFHIAAVSHDTVTYYHHRSRMVNSQASSLPPSSRVCAGCGGKISERFLLFSMDRYWHTRCLKCSCCQAHLGDIGSSCYSKGGMILCRSDYLRLFGHSGACGACGQSIPANEMVMRAQGDVFHLKCFSCATCRNRLVPGDRFHYVDGTIFCEHDRPGNTLVANHDRPGNAHLGNLHHDRPGNGLLGNRHHHDRPGNGLIGTHLPQLQSSSVLTDQKVC